MGGVLGGRLSQIPRCVSEKAGRLEVASWAIAAVMIWVLNGVVQFK